ncbi:MAG: hypothetical protein WB493_00230 [Anaeromyxobacteraceae bacterium]
MTASAPLASRWWTWVLAALAAIGVTAFVQFGFAPVPSDADTAYHAAVGRLLAEHGILRAFPWTPMSWLADHYADKELLFHLLFVPFLGLGWLTASKVVGTLAGAAVLLALYGVLRAERVRFAAAWAFLPLLASSAFLYRFTLVRPHLVSIALALVVLWSASRDRAWPLAIASFLYPWAYVAWYMPLVLVTVAEAARLASGERIRWRPAAVAAGGIALGLLVHPNGANLIRFGWLVLSRVLVQNAWGGKAGLEMGGEFDAFTPGQWLELLALVAAFCVAAVVLAWGGRKAPGPALAFSLAALAFGILTARTARFTEYFVPFSVAALALSLPVAAVSRLAFVPFALIAVALAYQGREEAGLLGRLREWPNRVPSYVAKVMQREIPPGSRVFTCEWGMTGHLMLALPDRQFLVALDPTLFQAKDPELYALWYASTRRPPPEVARLIRDRFGARYVACFYDPQFEALNARLASTPGVRTVLVSDDWNLYDLGEPGGPMPLGAER